jgi:hypothetical protein
MKIRGTLYRAGSALGAVKAVTSGRVPQRMARVAAYKTTGRALRAGGCLLPVLAVLLVLALAACGGGGRQGNTINGTFTLQGNSLADGNFIAYDGGCDGTGGYDDIKAGLQVTVSNEAGTVIANGALGTGNETGNGCQFPFKVERVPVAKFYKIAVGHRGELSYSHAEMKAAGWKVDFTLG